MADHNGANPQRPSLCLRNCSSGCGLSPRVATCLMEVLHTPGAVKANPFSMLTRREIEVLQHIANGKTNAEISEILFVIIKTVRAHVRNILSKLHLNDRTQAAVYAWRKGIVR